MPTRLVSHIVILFSDNPDKDYLAIEGVQIGWLISIIVIALWYFYVRINCFRTRLKITLPVYFSWDVIGIAVLCIFATWISVILCGGYYGFYRGLDVILSGCPFWFAYVGAFLFETLFLSSGVILGRHLDKKKLKTV